MAKPRQRARGWGERRRETRRGETRGGERRRETAQDTFVRTERTVRNGTVHRATRMCVCVFVCIRRRRGVKRRGEERERQRERARSRYALPTGATTPVTFVRSVLRPGPARFHRLLPPGGTTMRINPPPANLLPARLSNLCPVSARIGDRSNGLLEPLAKGFAR